MSAGHAAMDDASGSTAPERVLPSTAFYSVEYPGYVRDSSVQEAVQRLGGQTSLNSAFGHGAGKHSTFLELNFRPGNPFAHPVQGDVVSTSNLLLKVVKRRSKRSRQNLNDSEPIGEYTAEIIGVIPKTARFRSMADFQYMPPADDPVTKLRVAMEQMDVDAIMDYRIPPEKEDYQVPLDPDVDMNIDPQLRSSPSVPANKMRSNLRLFPPPMFSRQLIPQLYNYKPNTASVVATVVDEETGQEKSRLINRSRWKGYGPSSISFHDIEVPTGPPAAVEAARSEANTALVRKLQKLFDERPIWSRLALMNQLSAGEAREAQNTKTTVPLVAYVFQDGPWRDTYVRFGYDPRKHADSRFYQRVYFRNVSRPVTRPSVASRRQGRANETGDTRTIPANSEKSHIFDGVNLLQDHAAFQLCDIVDPMLAGMIGSGEDIRENPSERDGWYSTQAFEAIKTVLRHKFFCLLEGHVATEQECEALLIPPEGSSKPTVPLHRRHHKKTGKHNMAKGALPAEDLAALRLRAALEKNAKATVAAVSSTSHG